MRAYRLDVPVVHLLVRALAVLERVGLGRKAEHRGREAESVSVGGESLATEYPGTREQQGGPSRVCVCGAIVDGSEGALMLCADGCEASPAVSRSMAARFWVYCTGSLARLVTI